MIKHSFRPHHVWNTSNTFHPAPLLPLCAPLQVLRQALKDLESYWLAGGSRPFMTGDSLSVPDVLCVCELEQLQ
jgi:hypothetical protein